MANGNTNNIHPGSASGAAGSFSAMDFIKGNPIAVLLSGLVLLGIILPPRSRKRKPTKRTRRKYSKRRKSGNPCKTKNPGNPGKKKKGKKSQKQTFARKTKTRKYSTPAFMVKGSAAAKAHMSHLRSLRKK